MRLRDLIIENLVSTSTFFIRYIITCTFMSSLMYLFDVVHGISLCLKRGRTKNLETNDEILEDQYKKKLSGNKDAFYFPLGYNIAYSIIIYTIILIFSPISPIITPFGSCYFTVKYFIDKYNIVYVYPPDYNYSGGSRLYHRIIILQTISIFFAQLIVFSLFYEMFQKDYSIAISMLFVIGLQILMVIISNCVSSRFINIEWIR